MAKLMKSKRFLGSAVLAVVAAGTAFAATASDDGVVVTALKDRLPKTEVAKVDCRAMKDLCEVTSGKSIFYVDKNGRYLIIGHVFDMETRADLTAARLLEINPQALLGGASGTDGGSAEEFAAAQAGQPRSREAPQRRSAPAAGAPRQQMVSLVGLPASGAIEWGASGGQKVTIFTDLRCSYCRMLATDLETMNVKVVERPISVLGTRELSNRVYCAKNRVRALRLAYAGDVPAEARCDTSGLDANERFAKQNGFTGTPVIVRSDGAVHQGYMPKTELLAWLKGAKS